MEKMIQVIDSREVAEMLKREHKNVLRDITRYKNQFSQLKIEPSDFFIDSFYETERGKKYPCYKITKMGCEFLAHKINGVKGTAFTALYIKRFHQMEDALKHITKPQKQEKPVRILPEFSGRHVEDKRFAATFIQDYLTDQRTDTGLYNAYKMHCLNSGRVFLPTGMFADVKKKVVRLRLITGSWKPYTNGQKMITG